MLGRASRGRARDDRAGNATIECAEPTKPGSFNQWGRKLPGVGEEKCYTLDRSYTTTIRGTGVEASRSVGLRNVVSFANADHAKSSFGAIGSTATENNIGPDIRSCHRRPQSGGERPTRPTCCAGRGTGSANDGQSGTKSERGGEILRLSQNCFLPLPSRLLLADR
jgi:hypothetical protein